MCRKRFPTAPPTVSRRNGQSRIPGWSRGDEVSDDRDRRLGQCSDQTGNCLATRRNPDHGLDLASQDGIDPRWIAEIDLVCLAVTGYMDYRSLLIGNWDDR